MQLNRSINTAVNIYNVASLAEATVKTLESPSQLWDVFQTAGFIGNSQNPGFYVQSEKGNLKSELLP